MLIQHVSCVWNQGHQRFLLCFDQEHWIDETKHQAMWGLFIAGWWAHGVGSAGQAAPLCFTNCLLCPLARGQAMLCMCGYSQDEEHSFGAQGSDLVMRHHRAVPSGKGQDDPPAPWVESAQQQPGSGCTCWQIQQCLWFAELDLQVLYRAGWQPQWPAAGPRGNELARGHLAITDLIPALHSTGRSLWKGCKALGMENTTYSVRSSLSPWQRYGPCYIRISTQPKWLRLKLLQKVP